MLISKGYAVHCYVGGRKFSAPSSYGMLHDPSGSSWPSNSVLVAKFSKTGEPVDDADAEDYFGSQAKKGSLELPPRSLASWSELGSCSKIEYSRFRPHGLPSKFEGDYFHFFDGSEGFLSILTLLFVKAPEPTLFKRGRMLRLELPNWAELGVRGFVWP